jgi:hypothetical protein
MIDMIKMPFEHVVRIRFRRARGLSRFLLRFVLLAPVEPPESAYSTRCSPLAGGRRSPPHGARSILSLCRMIGPRETRLTNAFVWREFQIKGRSLASNAQGAALYRHHDRRRCCQSEVDMSAIPHCHVTNFHCPV